MALTRLNHFKATPGSAAVLFTALQQVVPLIQGSAGCLDCKVLQHQQQPEQVVVLER